LWWKIPNATTVTPVAAIRNNAINCKVATNPYTHDEQGANQCRSNRLDNTPPTSIFATATTTTRNGNEEWIKRRLRSVVVAYSTATTTKPVNSHLRLGVGRETRCFLFNRLI
jgi:hypothetical protein